MRKKQKAQTFSFEPLSIMAEGGRFELPVACATTDFESVTFGLSDTPPRVSVWENLYKELLDFFPALNS